MLYSKSTGGFYHPDINTDIPADAVEVADADYAAVFAAQAQGKQIVADADGYPVTTDPVPTPEQHQVEVVAAVQQRLDAFFQTRGYDGVLSACTYAASTVPKFQIEGQYAVQARDAHWSACYALLAQVEAGKIATPAVDQVLAQMPPLEWPL